MEKMKDGPQRVCVSRSEAGGCGLSIKAERTRTPPLGTRLLSVGFILTLTLFVRVSTRHSGFLPQDGAGLCASGVLNPRSLSPSSRWRLSLVTGSGSEDNTESLGAQSLKRINHLP